MEAAAELTEAHGEERGGGWDDADVLAGRGDIFQLQRCLGLNSRY